MCFVDLIQHWNNEMSGVQFEDMENEIVDIPDQGVNGFDFEWEG